MTNDNHHGVRASPAAPFAEPLLRWFARHGRKSLPWQGGTDAYRIWVAEVMLQQTRVETVIPYYQQFIAQFPDVYRLAAAELEQVLTHWAGLGYYNRARNLHRTAGIVCAQYGGRFPRTLAEMCQLPGLGRTTAAAILVFAYQQRQPILDGNVKRVLCRYWAVAGYPGTSQVAKQLWAYAEYMLPHHSVAAYTQAMMDLGATLCTRTRPDCPHCPVARHCRAHQLGMTAHYPTPRPHRPRPHRTCRVLLVQNARAEYLLVKRAPTGIWGGLWMFPQIEAADLYDGDDGNEVDSVQWCAEQLALAIQPIHPQSPLPPLRHAFTHFELHLQLQLCRLIAQPSGAVLDKAEYLWYNPATGRDLAVPSVVAKIFKRLPNLST